MLYFTKDIFDISIYNKYMYIELKEGMQITSDIVIDKYDYIVISGLCESVLYLEIANSRRVECARKYI